MANTTFSGPVTSINGFIGKVTGGVVGAVEPTGVLVAALPTIAAAGTLLYVSNANSGKGTIAFSDGTNWVDIKTGVTVIA